MYICVWHPAEVTTVGAALTILTDPDTLLIRIYGFQKTIISNNAQDEKVLRTSVCYLFCCTVFQSTHQLVKRNVFNNTYTNNLSCEYIQPYLYKKYNAALI